MPLYIRPIYRAPYANEGAYPRIHAPYLSSCLPAASCSHHSNPNSMNSAFTMMAGIMPVMMPTNRSPPKNSHAFISTSPPRWSNISGPFGRVLLELVALDDVPELVGVHRLGVGPIEGVAEVAGDLLDVEVGGLVDAIGGELLVIGKVEYFRSSRSGAPGPLPVAWLYYTPVPILCNRHSPLFFKKPAPLGTGPVLIS